MKKQYRFLSLLVAVFMILGTLSFNNFSFADEELNDGPNLESAVMSTEFKDEVYSDESLGQDELDALDELDEQEMLDESDESGFSIMGGGYHNKGKLTIHKRVKWLNGTINADFAPDTFDIRLTGPNNYDETLTIDKLNGTGDNVTFNGLANGTYYIEELNLDSKFSGYYISKNGNHGNDVGNKVKIKGSRNVNRWLINIEKEHEPEWKGKIKVKKTIEGVYTHLPSLAGFQFELWKDGVKVAGPLSTDSNGYVVFPELEAGEYEVVEVGDYGDYTPHFPDGSTVTISEDECDENNSKTVRVINKKEDTPPEWEGKIKVRKYVKGQEVFDGEFQFELWKDGAKVAGPYSTDEYGHVEFPGLEPGDYEVRELPKEGYIQISPQGSAFITIGPNLETGDGDVWYADFENKKIPKWEKGMVKVIKTKLGRKGKWGLRPIENPGGITFTLEGDDLPLTTATTNNFGFAVFNNLSEGTYTLKEQVPTGYKSSLPDEGIEVIVKKDKHSGLVVITVINKKLPKVPEWEGNIRVFKTIEGKVDSEIANLSGFEFELKDEDGNITGPYTTNGAGEVDFTGLEAGTYKVRELPREGYTQVSPEGAATVTIGPDVEGGDDNYWFVRFVNKKTPKKYRDVIIKKVFEGKEIDIPQLGLLDFEFELWRGGVKYASENSGGDFEAIFKNVPPGAYTLKEILTDEQKEYFEEMDDMEIIVKPCEDEELEPMSVSLTKVPREPKECEPLVIVFTNKYKTEKPKGRITIIKKFSDGRNPAGVEFVLEGFAEMTKTTNADGEAKFENLPLGSYILNEVEVPGYESSIKGGLDITISDESLKGLHPTVEVMNRKIPDKPNKGEIEVTKIVQNYNGVGIADNAIFTFRLEKWVDGAWITEATKTHVGNGRVKFEGLPDGKYRVREINIPVGYTLVSSNNLELEVYEENKQAVQFINRKDRTPPPPEDDPRDDPDPDPRPRPRPRPEPQPEPEPEVEAEEVVVVVVPEVEEEVVEEPVPEAKPVATLPKTGAASPLMTSGFGTLLLAAGLYLRRKRR